MVRTLTPSGSSSGTTIDQSTVNSYISQWGQDKSLPLSILEYGPANTSDWASLIETAAADAKTQNRRLVLPEITSEYPVSRGVLIPHGAEVWMEGNVRLVYTGSANITVLTYGENDKTLSTTNVLLRLGATRQTQSDWSNEAAVGIHIRNLFNCHVWLTAEKHTIGVKTEGFGKGNAHNVYYFGRLVDNLVHHDLIANDSTTSTGGYCNENEFVGGRWGRGTSVHTATESVHVRLSLGDSGNPINGNRWSRPAFENGNVSGGAVCVKVVDTSARDNEVVACREEGNNDKAVLQVLGTGAKTNGVHVLYTDRTTAPTSWLDDRSTALGGGTNWVRGGYSFVASEQAGASEWSIDDLAGRACQYDSAGTVFVAGLFWRPLSGDEANQTINSPDGNVTIAADYIEVPVNSDYGVCRVVDTSRCKRFAVAATVTDSSNQGRLAVRCFDANGAALTGTHPTSGRPYAKFLGSTYQAARFGGSYDANAPHDDPKAVVVLDEVQSVQVIYRQSGATEAMRLRGLAIRSLDPYPAPTRSAFRRDDGLTLRADQQPVDGNWKGNFETSATIANDLPSLTSDPVGWRNIAGAWHPLSPT